MTALLVPGVPDTDHVWHRVIARLGRDDVITLRSYAEPKWGERLAERTGFPGCSHWWPLQRLDEVAAELRARFARLPAM